MNKRNFIAVSVSFILAKVMAPFKSIAMDRNQESNWSTHKISAIDKQRMAEGGPYLSFINKKSLSTGLYVLPAGSEDKQKPHELDEVYYIIEGKSKFVVDGDTIDVNPGDVIFVKAQIEHRFTEIEKDLQILVFFSELKVS